MVVLDDYLHTVSIAPSASSTSLQKNFCDFNISMLMTSSRIVCLALYRPSKQYSKILESCMTPHAPLRWPFTLSSICFQVCISQHSLMAVLSSSILEGMCGRCLTRVLSSCQRGSMGLRSGESRVPSCAKFRGKVGYVIGEHLFSSVPLIFTNH